MIHFLNRVPGVDSPVRSIDTTLVRVCELRRPHMFSLASMLPDVHFPNMSQPFTLSKYITDVHTGSIDDGYKALELEMYQTSSISPSVTSSPSLSSGN